MYQYDETDWRVVRDRVAQFRDQTRRFLAGSLSEDEFRPLRLQNGLYIQRHAPMLRVAIPYGLMSSDQLRKLADVARDFDRGYGHFTTRQNLQYNWIPLERVPDALQRLAEAGLHAIQTSGHCIRNVTCDPLAGIVADEVDDPRPWCELIRQWAALHPEFSHLPRKFKFAVSASRVDRASIQVHDVGLRLLEDTGEGPAFEVWVGGGLGRAPFIARRLHERLPGDALLDYLVAILRVYNLHGRRDNLNKARIKFLVQSLGIDRFRHEVTREYDAIRSTAPTPALPELARIRARFRTPVLEPAQGAAIALDLLADREPGFGRWLARNTEPHRVAGHRIVFISLKASGRAPGDITADQMDALARLADQFSQGEIRSTQTQNLVLGQVRESDLKALWTELVGLELATPTIGTLVDTVCCPGLDFCSLANAVSIPVAEAIQARFSDLDYLHDLGELRVNLSGCMNACSHHHTAHIGLLGVNKQDQSWYQITLGGSARGDCTLGTVLGPSVPQARVPEIIERIVTVYAEAREADESFLDTFNRIGLEPFRKHVYGKDHSGRPNHRRSVAARA